MKAAEKEVELLERNARETAGLSLEPDKEGEPLPPIELPPFRVMQRQRRLAQKSKAEKERRELEDKVAEIVAQMRDAQNRLKALNEEGPAVRYSSLPNDRNGPRGRVLSPGTKAEELTEHDAAHDEDSEGRECGAMGPDGAFVEFPLYDGSEPPLEWKKAFAQYCNHSKKDLKASFGEDDRKDKVR